MRQHKGTLQISRPMWTDDGFLVSRLLVAHYEFYPSQCGAREPGGRQLEPDYGPDVDITGVLDQHGVDYYDLCDELGLVHGIEQEVLESLGEIGKPKK